MIVDDQVFNINALSTILEYAVNLDVQNLCESATSGKEALNLLRYNIE